MQNNMVEKENNETVIDKITSDKKLQAFAAIGLVGSVVALGLSQQAPENFMAQKFALVSGGIATASFLAALWQGASIMDKNNDNNFSMSTDFNSVKNKIGEVLTSLKNGFGKTELENKNESNSRPKLH